MLRTLRDTLWILALAIILLFVFFVALGAFDPGDVIGISVVVLVLVAAWLIHAVVGRRASLGERDEAAMRARERRGF